MSLAINNTDSARLSQQATKSINLDDTPLSTKLNSGPRVLIVDDQPDVRRICRYALQSETSLICEADNGHDAIKSMNENIYDVIILDIDLPGLSGYEILEIVRAKPPTPNLKVILFSGRENGDDLAAHLVEGADDFLTKPFSLVQLRARVKASFRLKEAQDHADELTQQVRKINSELETALSAKCGELVDARAAIVLALAKLVEQRSSETGPHLFRMRKYCRIICEAAMKMPGFAGLIDEDFINMLEDVAPLHDIGKVGIPDHVMNKPGQLTPTERRQMQAHTTIGADTLEQVARQNPFAQPFFRMAADVARFHHEKWDGTGYPMRIREGQIPLCARILAIGDVYDALRSKRVYKQGMTHDLAVKQILENSQGHFDPAIAEIFRTVQDQFAAAFRQFEE